MQLSCAICEADDVPLYPFDGRVMCSVCLNSQHQLAKEIAMAEEQLSAKWRTDYDNAKTSTVILLTKTGWIASGEFRTSTRGWWSIGGITLFENQLVGWLPRDTLPEMP